MSKKYELYTEVNGNGYATLIRNGDADVRVRHSKNPYRLVDFNFGLKSIYTKHLLLMTVFY